MTRNIEIFSAGCAACTGTIDLVNRMICGSCSVTILDMKDDSVAARAKALGIGSVPAVLVDGKLADCCTSGGPKEAALRAAGIGRAEA